MPKPQNSSKGDSNPDSLVLPLSHHAGQTMHMQYNKFLQLNLALTIEKSDIKKQVFQLFEKVQISLKDYEGINHTHTQSEHLFFLRRHDRHEPHLGEILTKRKDSTNRINVSLTGETGIIHDSAF